MKTRTLRRAGALAIATLAIGAAATPVLAASRTWNGAFDSSPTTKFHFKYSGTRMTNFTVPIVGCTSATGYQVETIHVPSIPVRHSRFSIKYHPTHTPKRVVVKLKGKLSGGHASGTLTGSGLCTTGPQTFHANPGKFKPVHVPARHQGACTMAGCLASDGVLIKVSGVDTTIKSIDDPTNIFDSSADPFLTGGGVGVSVEATNRSAPDPTNFVPIANFKLKLGSGSLVPTDAPTSTVVSQNGSAYSCGDTTTSAQLTRGASYGPTSICFDAASASDRQHLMLYYMPDGFDVDAKIPLN